MKGSSFAAVAVFAVAVLVSVSGWAQTQWSEPIATPDRFEVLESYDSKAVYDKETGLIWEREPAILNGQSALDLFNLRWQEAQWRCNRQDSGNRIGWRLPTVQELASLIDPSQQALPDQHPFINVQQAFYWSATSIANNTQAASAAPTNTANAWIVSFANGVVATTGKVNRHFLWCVHDRQHVDPMPTRFVVLDSYHGQAVLDTETGLVWEQSPDTRTTSWAVAQTRCNQKTVGNRKGWRLPTIQELSSLIHHGTPAFLPPGKPFSNVHGAGNADSEVFAKYWTVSTSIFETPSPPAPLIAWAIQMGDEDFLDNERVKRETKSVVQIDSQDHKAFMYAWCVRGGPSRIDPQ